MADAPVMRRHREAAYRLLHGSEMPPNDAEEHWLETGVKLPVSDDVDPVYAKDDDAQLVANLEREAEHRVRAAVIADLRGLLERAYKGDYVNRTLVVDADSIELLVETLEAQQS